MRVLRYYTFWIGTRIPFSEFPQIVRKFLAEHSLSYKRLDYYFEALSNGCARAVAEHPALGPIRIRTYHDAFHYGFLTNCDGMGGCGEEELMSMMTKIHRRYGFADTQFFYRDVDFFSDHIPASVDIFRQEDERFQGSGILVRRDGVFPRWNSISLSIDILFDGKTRDPSYYGDALAAMLPGCKMISYTKCVLDPSEQAFYDQLDREAQLMLPPCQSYIQQKLTQSTLPSAGKSVTATLKGLSKSYGYMKVLHHYHMTLLQKKTPNGHCLQLDIDTGRSDQECNVHITLEGMGFCQDICSVSFDHSNAPDRSAFLIRLFDAVAEAEKDVLSRLDNHFPATPDWFPF